MNAENPILARIRISLYLKRVVRMIYSRSDALAASFRLTAGLLRKLLFLSSSHFVRVSNSLSMRFLTICRYIMLAESIYPSIVFKRKTSKVSKSVISASSCITRSTWRSSNWMVMHSHE